MYKDFERLMQNHSLYMLCSLVYLYLGFMLLGNEIYGYIITIGFFILTVVIVFSPLAEKLLRFTNGIRSIETNEEREYLMPIFNEVMSTIPQEEIELNKKSRKIELCIIDKIQVNACAMGRRTVAITKGAMKAFDEEQLKGVIAHEVAHIRTGDTVADLYLRLACGYFYLFVLLFKLITLFMDKISLATKEKSVGSYLCSLTRTTSKFAVSLILLLTQIVSAIESRKREYRADRVAYEWGLGENLISALYLLEKISLDDSRTITQKMTASHPRTTARIGRLEGMAK
ncbi:MAG: M48 family metalloprotease [Oscillospiraceae bacterium]|jgi:Zn-dependent protease with chaperone function|nr:M48 family metalloprotease [Oscillospiraceae bacterium]